MVHWNIQGYTENFLELQMLVENCLKDTKVISLNEHWLTKDSIDILNNLDNFCIADFYARTQPRGGPVFFIKQT